MGHKVKQALVNSRIDFFYYAFRNVLLFSVPILIFSIFVFTIPHSSAEISSGTDNVQLVLSTSCTVNAVVTSEHKVSLNGGQLDNNVGNTKLSAYCNDNNGYSIYAVGSSGDTDGNTDLVNTINEGYNIRTGVYNDTIQTNPSSWAMKLTAGTGTGIDPVTGESVPTTPPTIINGYDNYSTIPNVYTQVAKRTSGTSMITDSDASGSYLNTTYQIYANSYQPAGTYNGKVKYVIVHPNSSNNNLSFNEAYALNGKNPAIIDGANVYYAMQDMNSQICNMVANTGAITATQLVDTRDNKLYWVAKLEDGHCWMTQNLDLDLDPTKTLTSNDTDLTDHSLSGAYVDGYEYDGIVLSWKPAKATVKFSGNVATGLVLSPITLSSAKKTDSTPSGHTATGNYYNWTAAIASNNSSSYSGDTYNNVGNNPQNSICPKGWRLPTVSSVAGKDEFSKLNNLYNNGSTSSDANLTTAPLWFVQSGFITDNNVLKDYDARGGYWSSTVYNASHAYLLNFNNSSVNPTGINYYDRYRNRGWSVRCVAR